jgi:hypothetical protein
VANYVKGTNFTVKDGLAQGDPGKILKGTEIDIELNSIAAAISTKADSNSPVFTGTPSAPTASIGTNNTQIATTAFAANVGMPIGGIILWSGTVSNIPVNWALCNGLNGTPDLRDRFVVGAGNTYSVGSLGGSKDSIVVEHTHTGSTSSSGNNGTFRADASGDGTNKGAFRSATGGFSLSNPGVGEIVAAAGGGQNFRTASYNASHTHSFTTASSGSSGTNANLPPYYALAYIMKIA